MIDVIKFYFSLVGELMSKIWGSFNLTANVTYLHFYIGCMLIIVLVTLFRFEDFINGINGIKDYYYTKKIKKAKHVYKPKHER